jgi:UDP-glucose 4-epimerase
MTIVVTGSESFVAKELIAQARAQGINVIGIDMAPQASGDYEYHHADIRSQDVADIIPDDVDAIVHLAALSRDPDCRGKAYQCFDVNVMGTLNLVNAAANKNAKQFIFASSEWVYEKFEGNEVKDEEAWIDVANHVSEYALSKLVSEANLRQRFSQGFCSATILRFGIIYGPRPNNWSAVESVTSTIKKSDQVTVGSLKNGRRFIHVSDIARGILASIGLSGFNIINLTGDRLITMGEIIETAERIFEKKVTVLESDPTVLNVRNASNEKAKRLLKWNPEILLEEGLRTLLPFL